MSSKASALFNNQDWKLSVTDINLYENTVSLDGQSYPLSLAIKTLIPGYLSGLPSTSREAMELLEALAEAGVTIGNFFSNDLMTAYQRRQMNKRVEAERIAKELASPTPTTSRLTKVCRLTLTHRSMLLSWLSW